MAGLWRNNPSTREGKYPIVLRRDGSPLESRYIVMTLKDPATAAALFAYAEEARELGMDENYYEEIRDLAAKSEFLADEDQKRDGGPTADPDAPRHRTDDPVVLAWARSIGCPGS